MTRQLLTSACMTRQRTRWELTSAWTTLSAVANAHAHSGAGARANRAARRFWLRSCNQRSQSQLLRLTTLALTSLNSLQRTRPSSSRSPAAKVSHGPSSLLPLESAATSTIRTGSTLLAMIVMTTLPPSRCPRITNSRSGSMTSKALPSCSPATRSMASMPPARTLARSATWHLPCPTNKFDRVSQYATNK